MKISLVCSACLAAIATTLPAHAYSLWKCRGQPTRWLTNPTLQIDSLSFPSGSAQRDEIEAGFQETNQNPSSFTISLQSSSTGGGINNNRNDAYFSNIAPDVAYAEKRMNCIVIPGGGVFTSIAEVDIVFSSTYVWTLTSLKANNPYYAGSGTTRPIRVSATHESGHVLGLEHVSIEYNVMGDARRHLHTNGSYALSYFGEDASDGAIALYGAESSSFEDVSASHWRYDGPDGANEYSVHSRTRMFDSSGINELNKVTVSGEPHYRVNMGQVVRAEFVLENNGKTTQNNVSYDIRSSNNDYISANDRLLTSGTVGSLARNVVYPRLFTVTIPTNLTSGVDYWIGVRMDSNNTINEVDGNNTAYIGIRVN